MDRCHKATDAVGQNTSLWRKVQGNKNKYTLPDRLMVGHLPLEEVILVRVQVWQPIFKRKNRVEINRF